MKRKPATKLKRPKFDRVDLVDRGAAPGAHVVLFKRDDELSADEAALVGSLSIQFEDYDAAWDALSHEVIEKRGDPDAEIEGIYLFETTEGDEVSNLDEFIGDLGERFDQLDEAADMLDAEVTKEADRIANGVTGDTDLIAKFEAAYESLKDLGLRRDMMPIDRLKKAQAELDLIVEKRRQERESVESLAKSALPNLATPQAVVRFLETPEGKAAYDFRARARIRAHEERLAKCTPPDEAHLDPEQYERYLQDRAMYAGPVDNMLGTTHERPFVALAFGKADTPEARYEEYLREEHGRNPVEKFIDDEGVANTGEAHDYALQMKPSQAVYQEILDAAVEMFPDVDPFSVGIPRYVATKEGAAHYARYKDAMKGSK